MKILILVISLFQANLSIGQSVQNDTVRFLTLPYRPAKIVLMKGRKIIFSTEINRSYKYILKGLEPGSYTLLASNNQNAIKHKDTVLIESGQRLELKYDGPCLFDHPEGYTPLCPKNHTNKIVPIVYGLVAFTNKSEMKKNRVRLGGCVVSDCDPKFYCRKHKIEF